MAPTVMILHDGNREVEPCVGQTGVIVSVIVEN